ncbi:MAG: class I adenylate-forming enzyme family protein [Actinomycetota bacterium]
MSSDPIENLGAIATPWADGDRIAFVDVTGTPRWRRRGSGSRRASGRDEDGGPGLVGYTDFDDRSARIAGALVAAGHRPGDRIAILADNSVDYGAAYLAMPRAGLVTVPLNTRQPAAKLAEMAADADVQLVIHDAANASAVPPGRATVELDTAAWDEFLATADPLTPVAVEPDDVAIQMYTSGSTGRPKGVLLSHGGQLFSIDQYVGGVLPLDPDDRLMVSAPMYHKNAGMQLKMALRLGGTVILLPRFDAATYLRVAAEHRATAVSGVPTMFALMAAQRELVAELDLSSVRRASIGSAPMTQALFDQARGLFPAATVTNGYGTTEVVAVFGGHPRGLPRPDITVGHPLEAVATRLVDPATGADAEPDPDTGRRQGELWVRSQGLMVGYHGMDDVTASKVTDGWYHTGDVMEADAEGWHYFVGRVDDMFVCGGENIYPGDVERMLEQSPDVHQASVVPVPDGLKGMLPVAFVVAAPSIADLEPEAAAAEIRDWALANGPAYAHPRAVWLVDELPLAGTNKIDRTALVAEAGRRWQPR